LRGLDCFGPFCSFNRLPSEPPTVGVLPLPPLEPPGLPQGPTGGAAPPPSSGPSWCPSHRSPGTPTVRPGPEIKQAVEDIPGKILIYGRLLAAILAAVMMHVRPNWDYFGKHPLGKVYLFPSTNEQYWTDFTCTRTWVHIPIHL